MVKKVLIITDPGVDPDDLVNAWLLANCHKAGAIEIVGMIANFSPAYQRAKLLKGILEDLGVDILVGYGTDCNVEHEAKPYEFSYPHLSSNIVMGQQVWGEILQKFEGQKITLLLTSGLTDVSWAIDTFPYFVKELIEEVYIMGGAGWQGELMISDPTASNNRFDPTIDPQDVYSFFLDANIPVKVLSRHAAYAVPFSPDFYEELKTINKLGEHLYLVQESAVCSLWQFANSNPPEHRQNRHWFARTFCGKDDLPIDATENPWQFVKKLALYDPLTSMWMMYPEFFEPSRKTIGTTEHQIVGASGNETGVKEPEAIVAKLKELLLT